MPGITLLVILLLIGIVASSNLIAIAACTLLIFRLANLQYFFPLLERRGLELGLLFLLLVILVPIANGQVTERDLIYNLSSWPGILAILGGALATHLNGEGLKLLQLEPQIIFGLVIGSLIGIVFFNGIPVGPLMAAGLTALFMEMTRLTK